MLSKFEAKSNFHLGLHDETQFVQNAPMRKNLRYLLYVDLSPIRAHPLLVTMCLIESQHRSFAAFPNPLRDLGMVVQELNKWPSRTKSKSQRQHLYARSLQHVP